jgi:hypothetical protein
LGRATAKGERRAPGELRNTFQQKEKRPDAIGAFWKNGTFSVKYYR